MRALVLWLVSPDWRGRALVVWVGWAYDAAKSLVALALAAAALAALIPRGRRRLGFLDPGRAKPAPRALKAPALALGALVLAVLKAAQYLSLQGSSDAAAYLAIVWNALRGGFMPSSVYGFAEHLAFRFNPILVLYAPLARLCPSPLFLMTAHAAAILSSVAVLWSLGRALKLPEAPRWLLCLLLAANPYFHLCLATWFFPETLPVPIFLGALLAWEKRRYGLFALLAALLLATKEEAGLALFGLGAAGLLMPERRRESLALATAAAAAFFAIALLRSSWSGRRSDAEWALFGWGLDAASSAFFLLAHPFAALRQWAWPPARFLPLLELLVSAGGLAALFPPALAGLVLVDAPHQAVLDRGFGYHRLDNNFSSYLLPLLFWGAARALSRFWPRARLRPALTAWLLAWSAAGLWQATDYVGFPRVSGPRLAAGWSYVFAVRPEEALWTAQAFAPALAFRERIRILEEFNDVAGDDAAFSPDAVLALKSHLGPEGTARLRGLLRRRRYAVAAEEGELILWRRAGAAPDRAP